MQKGANNSYFGSLREGLKSSVKGLQLSFRHFKNARKKAALVGVNNPDYFSSSVGTVTLQYPNEVITVPDNGRYRLYNEMDDCIVCDKCAKVCPVDCIDIEPIKSAELIGTASDGSPIRLYAAKFDIDMAKCCFCGLCTTVCPTECLTMTKAYDFSEFDVKDFNYHYANLSPEQAQEKKNNYEQFVLEKEAAKALKSEESVSKDPAPLGVAKPVFRPGIKKTEQQSEIESQNKKENNIDTVSKPKPVFRPGMKKPELPIDNTEEKIGENEVVPEAKPRPIFRPVIKKADTPNTNLEEKEQEETSAAVVKPKPVFRPVIRKPKEE